MSVGAACDWIAHAETLLAERKLGEAQDALRNARQLTGDIDGVCGNQWMLAMLQGDFESAWTQSDALRQRHAPDPHRFWNGESISGRRVIVRCLHGLGDAVQMLRYAPQLCRRAERVVFEVAPRFAPIARCFEGVSDVATWESDPSDDLLQWDVQVEIMELPYIFRTTLADLPLAQRYLHPDPVEVQRVADCMGFATRLKIGVVWTGGNWNPARSVPFELLSDLLDDDSIEFWSLQESGDFVDGGGMRSACEVCGDGLLSLAAAIANLDLVITIDTLAAHLAGAMGKSVWVMLPYAADWRWMMHREDSPWYPSMRLFRQPHPGDWSAVLSAVQIALRTQVEGGRQ